MNPPLPACELRHLGRVPYEPVWQAMRNFTDRRDEHTPDELWVLEHESVYTLGLAGNPAHLLNAGGIPVVKTDRGGQITWHGPGQIVVYVLLDLRRLGLGPRELVRIIESTVIATVAGYGIAAERRPGAPGVYVGGAKLAALGLRVRKGCSYHGLALNVDCALGAFAGINPCGYAGLEVTSLAQLGVSTTPEAAGLQLVAKLQTELKAHLRQPTIVSLPPACTG